MSELLSIPAELLCHGLSSLVERLAEYFDLKSDEENDEPRTPDPDDDFVQHDPEDTIFQEFESSQHTTDPSAWKTNLPRMRVSLKNSACFSFLATVIAGGLMGLASVFLTYFIIRVVYSCDWKPLSDPTYPIQLKRRRIIGESYQSFFLYFWQPALMCMVFKWSFLKDVNLFTCTLVGASIDLGYRFFLSVYELYHHPWIPYPLNVVYIAVVFTTSLTIARKIFQTKRRFQAILLAFKLCFQLTTGAVILYILWYCPFPWFARQEGFLKFVAIGLVLLVCILLKIVARQCILRLDGVNHPGTSYVLVSSAYGAISIILRLMQAEFKSLLAFTALSVGYGVIRLAYDLINVLRDYYSEKKKRILYSKLEPDSAGRAAARYMNTPRAQRLAADLAIQEMLFNSTAVMLSVGIISVYGFIHQTLSAEMFQEMIVELVVRIVLGLFIEFLFNIVSVILLTRRRNVPVLRVWYNKWKSHLTACLIAVVMTVTYSVDKLLIIIRARYIAKGKISIE